jgi:hypothetical protein
MTYTSCTHICICNIYSQVRALGVRENPVAAGHHPTSGRPWLVDLS